jgi:hypothetical protein
MANNAQQTALFFKVGSTEQVQKLIRWLQGEDLPEELRKKMVETSPDCFDPEEGQEDWQGDLNDTICDNAEHDRVDDQDGVYVGVSEGNLDLLATILDHALQNWPDVPSPQGFEWASWCSRLRVGEFAGGAVALRRGVEPCWFTTGRWLQQQLETKETA